MSYYVIGEILIGGIAVGSIYGLVAMGFVLIFKSSRVLNFSQGSLVLVGAYLVYAFMVQIGLPFFVSLFAVFLISIVMAFSIERCLLRPMLGKSTISVIMVTIGLDYLLRGVCLVIWGSSQLSYPNIFPDISIKLGQLVIASIFVWSFTLSISLLIALVIFFKYSKLGIVMRASSNDPSAALSLGISVNSVLAYSWLVAIVVALLGGVLLASLGTLDLNLGLIGITVFSVVIFGGMDSILGAILGGWTIGVLEKVTCVYFAETFPGEIKSIAPVVLMLLILMIRPYGLFGTREIERI